MRLRDTEQPGTLKGEPSAGPRAVAFLSSSSPGGTVGVEPALGACSFPGVVLSVTVPGV